MLSQLSENIAECYRHAEDCALWAKSQIDPSMQQEFLNLERRWLVLAHSYELAERLKRFQHRPTP